MTIIIGTDEAGYGPNLGPLVISATVWRVPESMPGDALYEQLPSISATAASRAARRGLVMADSKTLFTPGGGLANLERPVLAALGLVAGTANDGRSNTWRDIFAQCDPSCVESLGSIPWYQEYDRNLPIDADPSSVDDARASLDDALREGAVQLVDIQSQVVFPANFNERVAEVGSKGTALSLWTLELVERLAVPFCDGPILIQCDKHGARNRYGALLQQVFPEYLVEVREEAKHRSVYRWGPETRRLEATFQARGERFMPAALASMTSKYLRELAMLAFNRYWCALDPALKPTAGYPVDAKRFREAIRETQQQQGISDAILWRDR